MLHTMTLFLLLRRACCYDYFPYTNSCTPFIHITSHQFIDQISPGQDLQAHTHTHTHTHKHTTDDNDIRPHTVQEHNERTSTEFNLVTEQSTAHDHPEGGRIYMDRKM